MNFRNCLPVGVVTREQHFFLLNRNQERVQNYDGSWSTNPYWMKKYAGQWWEIHENEYWYFLEVLPPMLFDGNNFAMSEFDSDDLTHCYLKIKGRYFCGMIHLPNKTTGQVHMYMLRENISMYMDDYRIPKVAPPAM
jgi:hypothetical protein